MNTLIKVSAAPHLGSWHTINWKRQYRTVRRLQTRIVKATQEKQWRRVKALQRLLTRSFAAKALAVRRVTENSGRKTPGIDGKTWSTPAEKWNAINNLRRNGYKPSPLKRIYIPKSNGKLRPLGIPTMKDRAMQALYLLALEPVAETTADRNSYGFRPHRSCADAIEQVFNNLNRKTSATWVLEGDIKGCFDNISHKWLLEHIPMDKRILRSWLNAGFMEKGRLFTTDAGTPQGAPCSPVLANMCLDGLETILTNRFGRKGTAKASKSKVNYVRYADDFIVTGISREILESEVKPLITAFMQERGLLLSEEKTTVTHINDGFDFLGQNVRKYKGKLLIKPSKHNLKMFLNKIRATIEGNKTAKTDTLIKRLNPLIRGWTNYHQHVVAAETFRYVNFQLWKKIWRWCLRRHPSRGKRWIRRKYFDESWRLHSKDADGHRWVLYKASTIPIRRHIKIKSEANPYAPEWESYFEKRQALIWLKSQNGRNRIVAIWRKQEKRCPICGQSFSQETGWDIHHIVRKTQGGSDNLDNLVMLHPNCHRQLHHSSETGSQYWGLIKA
ncbi:TPA: group II intron reverse transcriptase/maturase [Shigella flexneri]|uniref:group II intron reverse transcriptase/maturase n=2 Tax=Shigella flexneri TaxID=623 RepID=UPI000B68FBCB|nr:group II intron reverse transcriptase/maturase [Shigella flexneri]EFF9346118.1 group II intron reverse transcriptase/maturase [Escherichia coli]EAA0617925.1 group II intron reverse transcriptase/maturase [Shigella flexneri]EAA1748918.1 group II intron reverse transcriptase/maturase [Shigella flexneri]EFG3275794.1 group II intron reverse transcriptase/maturase [Escherichia coli]EFP8483079.1 group II intron reverse transcriptase/maturase [Shigella flexneri]